MSAIETVWFSLKLRPCLSLMRHVRHRPTFNTCRIYYFYCMIIFFFCEKKSLYLNSKFKTTYRASINHGHIYGSNYQGNTTQNEQKGLTLFPEGKQAWNPGGMNVNTEAPSARNVMPQSSELRPRDFFWMITTFKSWATYSFSEP